MIEVFKILKGFNKVDSSKFFKLSENTKTRGHTMKLVKTRTRLDCRKYFFTNRVIDNWNSLPQYVVDAPSINAFKNRYDSLNLANRV